MAVPGVAGFCGVVYPLLDAVDDDDDDDVEDEEDEASEERDIGLRRLIWSEQQSPLVEAALEPGLLPVGVDTAEVTGEPAAIEATGM